MGLSPRNSYSLCMNKVFYFLKLCFMAVSIWAWDPNTNIFFTKLSPWFSCAAGVETTVSLRSLPVLTFVTWEDNLGLSDSTENKTRNPCNSVNLLEVMLHAAARWRRQFLGWRRFCYLGFLLSLSNILETSSLGSFVGTWHLSSFLWARGAEGAAVLLDKLIERDSLNKRAIVCRERESEPLHKY